MHCKAYWESYAFQPHINRFPVALRVAEVVFHRHRVGRHLCLTCHTHRFRTPPYPFLHMSILCTLEYIAADLSWFDVTAGLFLTSLHSYSCARGHPQQRHSLCIISATVRCLPVVSLPFHYLLVLYIWLDSGRMTAGAPSC